MSSNLAIIIVGPTASGKTRLSLELAAHYRTSILSADSRQCFRELTIGTAKPSAEELSAIPHYFINSHSIGEEMNASLYEGLALNFLDRIFRSNPVAIVCGGTGLYVKALCEGLDPVPEIPQRIRISVREEFGRKGMEWLYREVERRDPGFLIRADRANPARLMRALEVVLSTGKSLREFQTGELAARNFTQLKIGLAPERDALNRRIDERVDRMMDQGLLEEVKGLLPYRNRSALQTLGYRELFEFLDGSISLEEAVAKIRQHTRAYAKRQGTWFRRDPAVHWMKPDSWEEVRDWIGSRD